MYEELTISAFHDGLRTGSMTCSGLVKWYLERIETIDAGDGGLNAVVTVNPQAGADAAEADEALQRAAGDLPPLFGVPILVKDQALTKGIRTTFGSALFAEYVPQEDATLIRKLREAGGSSSGRPRCVTSRPDGSRRRR